MRRFVEGPDAGEPAVTRHDIGRGSAYYVATRLGEAALRELLAPLLDAAGVVRERVPGAVEAVRRERDGRAYLFLLNHGDEAATVAASGSTCSTGASTTARVVLEPGGVRVLREAQPALDLAVGRPRLAVRHQPGVEARRHLARTTCRRRAAGSACTGARA